MADLSVTSKYLVEVLAAAHTTTIKNFEDSAKATDGAGVTAWVNNGLACGPANDTVVEVEARRAQALGLMIKVAEDLATKLKKAADAYEGTDHKAAGDIAKQVRPG